MLGRALTTFSFAALVLLCSACGHHSKTIHESDLTHAYRLIDDHKDDEAIVYLENLCKRRDPTAQPDDRCLVALASAYAHKGGIKVQRFVAVVNSSKNAHGLDLSFESSPGRGEVSSRVDSSILKVGNYFSKISSVFSVYASIPEIKEADVAYLEEAIKIMDSLAAPTQSDALYRAVLRVVEFKYVFAEEVIGAGEQSKLGAECALNLELMIDTIRKLESDLNAIFDDLSLANPSKAKGYDKVKVQLANATLNLTSDLSSLTFTDEAASLYFKRLVIEQGFGKLLKCQGGNSVSSSAP